MKISNKMKEAINQFIILDKSQEELKLDDIRENESMSDVVDYLENTYAASFEEMETNGWQCYMWYSFSIIGDGDFVLEFAAFINNGLKITRSEA